MKRAVLMIVDGLRADLVTPEFVPNLAALAKSGRTFTAHRSVFPSATRVNAASIATGCLPASHGLAGNAIALDEGDGLKPVSVGPPEFRDRLRAATGRTLHRPGLSERLRERGRVMIHSNSSAGAAHMLDPDGHGWLFHRSGSFAPGLKPVTGANHLDISYDSQGDAIATERFVSVLADNPGEHPVHLLWICEPDHSQHAMELGSPEHREILAGADRCVAQVMDAVTALRSRGDDVLFLTGSDHGHETVDEIVPVTDLLVEAGLKASAESSDVVLASSGMGALLYCTDPAPGQIQAITRWLNAQAWCARVFAGDSMREVGQRTDGSPAIAFSMSKRDEPNRFGVMGLGHVAGDPFTSADRRGRGQHGGLGPYETRPFLIAQGSRVAVGASNTPSRTTDIAPTILAHLGEPVTEMDGAVLPLA